MSSLLRHLLLAGALGAASAAALGQPGPAPGIRTNVDAAGPSEVPGAGEVIGRNERMLIFVPGNDDTLESIAARFLGAGSRAWVIADFNGASAAEPGRPLIIPLTELNPTGVRFDHFQTVPILCYHRFGSGGNKMVVAQANFAAQLDWLARNDYRVIRLGQLLGYLEGRQALPRRAVVITIDDGYESVHRIALPLLRRYGFPATLFVYTDFVGAAEGLSWSQLLELQDSGLVDIQAHSKTHRSLIERSAGESELQYRQALETEVRAPRELLERRLPTHVSQFAFPYGDSNELVLDVLSRQKYQLAVTVTPGTNAFFAQPFMLRRTMIFGDYDLEAFKARLQVSRAHGVP